MAAALSALLRGLLVAGQPADHRAEERDAVRRLEVDDRRDHVLAGQRERLVGLGPDLSVPRLLVQGVGETGGQADLSQDRLDEREANPNTVQLGRRAV